MKINAAVIDQEFGRKENYAIMTAVMGELKLQTCTHTHAHPHAHTHT